MGNRSFQSINGNRICINYQRSTPKDEPCLDVDLLPTPCAQGSAGVTTTHLRQQEAAWDLKIQLNNPPEKKLLKALLKAIRMLYRCWLLNAWQANANMKKGACLMYASYQHSTVLLLQYLIFIYPVVRSQRVRLSTTMASTSNLHSKSFNLVLSVCSLEAAKNGGSATATDPPRQDATARVKPANSKHPGLLH